VQPQPLCSLEQSATTGWAWQNYVYFVLERFPLSTTKKPIVFFVLITLLSLIEHHKWYQTFSDTSCLSQSLAYKY